MSITIVIMAKAPLPGQAKTRLGASVGDETAARLHATFLAASVETAILAARSLTIAAVKLMAPDETHGDLLRGLMPSEVEVWSQRRPGLMAGIAEAFERSTAERTLVTATDSPSLPAAHIASAAALLDNTQHSFVLGPCADGGYYLAGARGLNTEAARDLFEGEKYQSDTICQKTASRAKQMGLAVSLAPEWYDIDTIEDLRRLVAELENRPADELRALRTALASTEVLSA